MYAVIRAGGKQYKVAKGDVLEIELVGAAPGRGKGGSSDEIEFVPLLVVDDKGKTRSARSELSSARVKAKIVGETQGPKVDIFRYRSKSRNRRHIGHRQKYTSVEISDISLGGRAKKSEPAAATKETKEEGDE